MSTDQLKASLLDFCNAIETAANNLKHQLDEKQSVEAVTNYDPERIPWTHTEGKNGPYERYPASQQKPLTSPDYTNLLEDLKKHNKEKLTKSGRFYWLFEDGITIGRKPAKW